MERLRKECPWDAKQTHQSLKKYVIEEAYELVDAIDSQDAQRIKEELGDLLLQVVFHAQIAKENGTFDIRDVIEGLCEKLEKRHPHVFGDEDAQKVLSEWEKRKAEERESVLDGIPRSMPALLRSQKLQDRASLVGFDFENVHQALEKLHEEIQELRESIEKDDRENLKHELGDILTAVVEIGRLLNLDAEMALQEANDRFERRFRLMEKLSKERGYQLKDMTLEEMDRLWIEAKKRVG